MKAPLPELFGSLFSVLRTGNYVWEAVTPERLQQLRKAPETLSGYSPFVRFFGIGLPDSSHEVRDELLLQGLPENHIQQVLELRPAVTRVGDLFVPHSHWPPVSSSGGSHTTSGYVHLGPESLDLSQYLTQLAPGARVLDLGSGSGIHSLLCAQNGAAQTLGLEIDALAVEWSGAAAQAQNLISRFKRLAVGSPEADAAVTVSGASWNVAISNPPLTVPSPGENRPHRDGGRLGIELPLLFLDFAAHHLETRGEAFFTVTNPLIGGKSAFFDRLDRKVWEVVGKKRLTERFNASLHRKEGYSALGIESIELWFLHLRKKLAK